MLSNNSQLDRIQVGRNAGNLFVSEGISVSEKQPSEANKNAATGARSIDAMLIDNSGCLASNIIVAVPELRQPSQLLKDAKNSLSLFSTSKSQMISRLNAERPAELQINTFTAKLDDQHDALTADARRASGAVDYSNLSGYSLRWSRLMDSLVQLLMLIKAEDDKLKSRFMQLQTASTERAAEKTIAAGKNVLTGAISGAAINVAWTTGAVAGSGIKTQDHTKTAGKNLNNQQDIGVRSHHSSNTANNPGFNKNKNESDVRTSEKHDKSADKLSKNKNEKHHGSNKHFKDKENYDSDLRKLYAVTSFGSSFEKIANSAGDMQASTNRAQSAIADNERSVHQKSSENSADMEGKTFKAAQALLDLLLQLLSNTANTNNAIINRAN